MRGHSWVRACLCAWLRTENRPSDPHSSPCLCCSPHLGLHLYSSASWSVSPLTVDRILSVVCAHILHPTLGLQTLPEEDTASFLPSVASMLAVVPCTKLRINGVCLGVQSGAAVVTCLFDGPGGPSPWQP